MTKLLAAMLLLSAAGCAPRPAVQVAPVPLDTLCERALQDLAVLIEERAADGTVAPDAVAEARALHDAATDLYLEGESELALELCDQAFLLLGKDT
jgi:hypothetical protein